MRTNTSLTLYSKSIVNRAEVWTRSTIPAAEWENSKMTSMTPSGIIWASKVKIFIPLGTWEIYPEDYLVNGTITQEIGANYTISDLRAEYGGVVVRSANKLDFGSSAMRHWEIEAN